MAADATPRRRKGSSSNTSSVDRISDLPESLISYILSSLPTKDAVATSILSRSWRFRWTKVTSFNFDNVGSKNDDSVRTTDFVDSVNLVLLSHCGESIEKFRLRWESSQFRPIFLITWANIAIAQKVRVLDLKTVNRSGAYCEFYLPSLLYTSGTLEGLKLEGPFRVKPPNLVCLPKLGKMELKEVIYESDEAVHKLISGCPVLESLTIKRVNKRDNLVVCSISSPLLKNLFICFHDENKEGVVGDMKLSINAPALEVLIIFDFMSSHISIQQQLLTSVKSVVFIAPHLAPMLTVELMKTFSSVNCRLALHVDMMPIDGATLPVKVSFERLVKLIVFGSQWSSVMALLDGCSILKELGISYFRAGGDPWINPARVPRCLSSLRRITFGTFDGSEEEIAKLKFLLHHCLALERVDICCRGKRPDDEAKRCEILNKVSTLSRASPACKIAFLELSAVKKYMYSP